MVREKGFIAVTGLIVGGLSILLMVAGNPPNMGMCIACFLRDMAGGLGLHAAGNLQYVRPELMGMVLGAFAAAMATRSYRAVGGSSALTRFVLGFVGMIGLLVFLGCPLRMLLRMAAGDLNAWIGIVGLAAGIGIGIWFISRGFTLGRAKPQSSAHGYVFPAIFAGLLFLVAINSTIFLYSAEGPGAMRAPLLISLGAGLIIGVLVQRTRMCLIGPIRDFIMFRDSYLMYGMVGIFIAALIGNLIIGNINPGFAGQPVAHTDGLWNFMGMLLGGICFTLIAGCPLRQMISASEGNTDSAITTFGVILGAAAAHNFGLAASPEGVPINGQIAVVVGLAVVAVVGFALSGARVLQQRQVTKNV